MAPARLHRAILVAAFLVASGSLPLLGPRLDEASDPLGTTVVAQHVLSTGHLSLFGPAADFFRLSNDSYRYQAQMVQGRLEYYFPLGPVILAMPVVALANAFGFNAVLNDARLQDVLIVLSSSLTLLISYVVARTGRSIRQSLMIAFLVVYGTVLGPTIGGAFWSINGEVVVTGCVFLLLIRETRSRLLAGILLGSLLFLGFLLRPTFSCLIACVLVYLAIKNRPVLFATAPVALCLLAAFVLFSMHHYGTYLPPYYLASRLSSEGARAALSGLLFSPSRSIFVFSPLLLLLPCLFTGTAASFSRGLKTAFLAAIVLEFLSNVFFPNWWGGASYGPRILCSMSYLGCLCVIRWSAPIQRSGRWRMDRIVIGLLGAGLVLNAPGLLDPYTHFWNERPPIDDALAAIFDWRYPQFLSVTWARVQAKCDAQKILLKPGVQGFCESIPKF